MFKDRKLVLVSLIISLILSIAYISSVLYHNNGHLSAPLDDSFIYLDYAKTFATTGELFTYNPGDEASTGATSFIYPYIISIGFFFGLDGEYIVLWIFLLQFVILFLFILLIHQIIHILIKKKILSYIITIIIVFNGNLLWGFFAQMEVPLYTYLMFLTAFRYYRYIRDNNTKSLIYLTLVMIAFVLTRPDGFYFSAILILTLFIHRLMHLRNRSIKELIIGVILKKEWLLLSTPLTVYALIVLNLLSINWFY